MPPLTGPFPVLNDERERTSKDTISVRLSTFIPTVIEVRMEEETEETVFNVIADSDLQTLFSAADVILAWML